MRAAFSATQMRRHQCSRGHSILTYSLHDRRTIARSLTCLAVKLCSTSKWQLRRILMAMTTKTGMERTWLERSQENLRAMPIRLRFRIIFRCAILIQCTFATCTSALLVVLQHITAMRCAASLTTKRSREWHQLLKSWYVPFFLSVLIGCVDFIRTYFFGFLSEVSFLVTIVCIFRGVCAGI